MTLPELKPCPFCGQPARPSEQVNSYYDYVQCVNLDCWASTYSVPRAKWNRRVGDSLPLSDAECDRILSDVAVDKAMENYVDAESNHDYTLPAPRAVIRAIAAALPSGSPRPDFNEWYAKPCERCGGKRDYRVSGEMQTLCFRCASPEPSGSRRVTAQMLFAAFDDARGSYRGAVWVQDVADALNAALTHAGPRGE